MDNPLNLYLLTQREVTGYDTYDSAVVAAETAEYAVMLHPNPYVNGWLQTEPDEWDDVPSDGQFMAWIMDGGYLVSSEWPAPKHVIATLIGVADPSIKRGVVCASFNAG